ncbi:hypothetical protein [Pseudotabrizicola alkalilacus]|uniref:Uncharacterized protein n=1 Tax=Pseudotabrizicola alkalilacus TaxID=2305252 RepID=A0A411Z408_9RHOB|nr:hypothetical protein [Pseudotabrizicola alkalilacus]RGP37808.1 hypothetical protein D1012_07850 [Pseudotabrizicola alkalilacus]
MRLFLFFSGLTLLSLAVILGTARMQHSVDPLASAATQDAAPRLIIRNMQQTRAQAPGSERPTAGDTLTKPTLLITLTRGSQPKGARFVRPPAAD